MLNELATQVMLGSERRPPVLPAVGGELGALLAAACPPGTGVEQGLLRHAGAAAVYGDAGVQPLPPGTALPPPCGPETAWVPDEPALLSALRQSLDEGPPQLLREALALLAACGAMLPADLLPRALDAGQQRELRAVLAPVLGRRGAWLATLNPDWAWAIGSDDEAPDPAQWAHGSLDQRLQLLVRLRGLDPAAARALLQPDFASLDARERRLMLEQLVTGLGPEDEDFLEATLADRSKEVRQQAAELLARLPHSRYQARMAERLAACLRQERKLLRQQWVVEPPQAAGADWKADALETTRPKSEALGERAWWLYQLTRALPPAWWCAHTGLAPAELLSWAEKGDWGAALTSAWVEVLQRQPDPDWADALLSRLPPVGGTLASRRVDAIIFLDQLAPAARERHWLRLLDSRPEDLARGEMLRHMVESLGSGPAEFPAPIATRVLDQLRALLPRGALRWDYALRASLADFVCRIAPEALDAAGRDWPLEHPEAAHFTETMAQLLAIIERRKTLHRSLSPRKSP